MRFSIVVPVYNRPDELSQLLSSLGQQHFTDFEVIVVEDGSTVDSTAVVHIHRQHLALHYHRQENAGPAAARNLGASQAKGEYLIFLDSDCICPAHYLSVVDRFLQESQADAFGGPDTAHPKFSALQKAINYAMTARLTTGGMRGGSQYRSDRFLPRSFNMGVRKEVFEQAGGFDARLRFGEDLDLSLRLRQLGFRIALAREAWVYHQRRSNWRAFFKQVYNAGMARVYLSERHPGSLGLIHLLPSLFVIWLLGLLLCSLAYPALLFLPLFLAFIWFSDAFWSFGYSPRIALLASIASYLQLIGYGSGFLHAWFARKVLRREPQHIFLKNFYR